MLIEFLKCYFDEANYPSDVTKAAADCVESLFGDYWSHGSLLNCSRGAQSAEILKDFERNKVSTLLPHLAYVPWLTVDGRHNYGAESHLTRTVCDQYPVKNQKTAFYFLTEIISERTQTYLLLCATSSGTKTKCHHSLRTKRS